MIRTDPELARLEQRAHYYANQFNMTLPEVRFFILDGLEFASLLEKGVYPVSPINIWEGKRMISKKHRIETGLESSLYYEVVQTGNPSYAYLNSNNSPMVQATVMAHVLGHCEFSELNVLRDSTPDRTEKIMWQVKKAQQSREQMGEKHFFNYWNAAESAIPLISPNSKYNLERTVDTDLAQKTLQNDRSESGNTSKKFLPPYSSTMETLFSQQGGSSPLAREIKTKLRQESLNRRGFRLRAPCQDVFGFLKNFAPATPAERNIVNYLYNRHYPSDFVIRTQVMNEGWAMYWEKKIMTALFREKACTGIIDYARIFSGVCYPRPYYHRNPYHLGFHLWCHIEELYRKGRISLSYLEETDREKKEQWNQSPATDPVEQLRHLVKTITDYEFLRRFLTLDLVEKLHLNRIPQRDFVHLGIPKREVIKEDRHYVWLEPEPIKKEMLGFYTHYYRPRIYVIDADFQDGGLLLFHRDDGRRLKTQWIQPTLKNLNLLWKGGVSLLSRNTLYSYVGGRHREQRIRELSFETVMERMLDSTKPLRLD